jgi:hypothetical protein
MRTTIPLFDDPVAIPEFDQLVRELDELIREEFRKELEPAIEDLVLARLGRQADLAA